MAYLYFGHGNEIEDSVQNAVFIILQDEEHYDYLAAREALGRFLNVIEIFRYGEVDRNKGS